MLKVLITSFSYKTGAGIPKDPTEHGGGFVFDCRCLPNPGRGGKNADKTGLDQEIQEELEASSEVKKFYDAVWTVVQMSVSNYLERGFDHVMISFGCTGGQHRSVYLAEMTAKLLAENSQLQIELIHQGLLEKGMMKGSGK